MDITGKGVWFERVMVFTHLCLSETTTLSSRGRPRNFWPHGQISLRSNAVFHEACVVTASSVRFSDDDIPPAKDGVKDRGLLSFSVADGRTSCSAAVGGKP